MIYLKSFTIKGAGPIDRADIKFEFNQDASPKPMVIVGENGAGKTTLISFVVDSLLQMAASELNDVLTAEGFGHLFFRLRGMDIKIGHENSYTHLRYDFNGQVVDYIDRAGSGIDLDNLRQEFALQPNIAFDHNALNEKTFSGGVNGLGDAFREGVYVFFPGGRREVPHWMQTKAIFSEEYSNKQRFKNKSGKSFVVEMAAEETAKWIMDALLDRAIGYPGVGVDMANGILAEILEDPGAHFAVAPRNVWPRIQIYTIDPSLPNDDPNRRKLRIPSLSHLSAGQSMLLSMFGTIANQGTLYKKVDFSGIEGIVVIDEAEVYLHTNLQRAVLPRLIKKFPKIQFIITTHSPSFLMGMKSTFSDGGFNIVQLPSGRSIDANQFAEVGAAVDALRDSFAFRTEVESQISELNNMPLLLVEGKTDSLIIDGLWRKIFNCPPPFKIISARGRRALRYLLEDEQFVNEVGENVIVLGLFDFDEAFDDWNSCAQMYPQKEGADDTGLLRKSQHKRLYAGLLPVPPGRGAQAGESFAAKSSFTIEMYLPDEILEQRGNLERVNFPGNVLISRFRGDKNAFANFIVDEPELHAHFLPLLNMLGRVFHIPGFELL